MAKKKSEEHENLRAAVKDYEKQYICRMLNKHDWNKLETAKALGIGLSSLYRKIDELKIGVHKKTVKHLRSLRIGRK
ncbi:hypothetical protein ES703_29972 [subsurface metagenome]